jgi:hypothetical protein
VSTDFGLEAEDLAIHHEAADYWTWFRYGNRPRRHRRLSRGQCYREQRQKHEFLNSISPGFDCTPVTANRHRSRVPTSFSRWWAPFANVSKALISISNRNSNLKTLCRSLRGIGRFSECHKDVYNAGVFAGCGIEEQAIIRETDDGRYRPTLLV